MIPPSVIELISYLICIIFTQNKTIPWIDLNSVESQLMGNWEFQKADINKMTIQHCTRLILLHFRNNSLYTLNGGQIENSPPPLPSSQLPQIQIASNL